MPSTLAPLPVEDFDHHIFATDGPPTPRLVVANTSNWNSSSGAFMTAHSPAKQNFQLTPALGERPFPLRAATVPTHGMPSQTDAPTDPHSQPRTIGSKLSRSISLKRQKSTGALKKGLSPEKDDIGLALGSPSQFGRSNSRELTMEPGTGTLTTCYSKVTQTPEWQPKPDSQPRSGIKKWRSVGELFGRKKPQSKMSRRRAATGSSTAASQSTSSIVASPVQTARTSVDRSLSSIVASPAQTARPSIDRSAVSEQWPNRDSSLNANPAMTPRTPRTPAPRRRHDTIEEEDEEEPEHEHRPTPRRRSKKISLRSKTKPCRSESFKTRKSTSTKASRKRDSRPRLDVDIPNAALERYSIMFSEFLQKSEPEDSLTDPNLLQEQPGRSENTRNALNQLQAQSARIPQTSKPFPHPSRTTRPSGTLPHASKPSQTSSLLSRSSRTLHQPETMAPTSVTSQASSPFSQVSGILHAPETLKPLKVTGLDGQSPSSLKPPPSADPSQSKTSPNQLSKSPKSPAYSLFPKMKPPPVPPKDQIYRRPSSGLQSSNGAALGIFMPNESSFTPAQSPPQVRPTSTRRSTNTSDSFSSTWKRESTYAKLSPTNHIVQLAPQFGNPIFPFDQSRHRKGVGHAQRKPPPLKIPPPSVSSQDTEDAAVFSDHATASPASSTGSLSPYRKDLYSTYFDNPPARHFRNVSSTSGPPKTSPSNPSESAENLLFLPPSKYEPPRDSELKRQQSKHDAASKPLPDLKFSSAQSSQTFLSANSHQDRHSHASAASTVTYANSPHLDSTGEDEGPCSPLVAVARSISVKYKNGQTTAEDGNGAPQAEKPRLVGRTSASPTREERQDHLRGINVSGNRERTPVFVRDGENVEKGGDFPWGNWQEKMGGGLGQAGTRVKSVAGVVESASV